jgi:signal transduction histidine kinase
MTDARKRNLSFETTLQPRATADLKIAPANPQRNAQGQLLDPVTANKAEPAPRPSVLHAHLRTKKTARNSRLDRERMHQPPSVFHEQILASSSFSSSIENAKLSLAGLQAFTLSSFLIVTYDSPTEIFIHAASADLAHFNQLSVDVHAGPLQLCLQQSGETRSLTSDATTDSPFTELGRGKLLVSPAVLGPDATLALLLFRNEKHGDFALPLIQAIQAQTQMLRLAATANVLGDQLTVQSTQAQQLRIEMQDSERFFRGFSEAVTQCFWVLDPEQKRVVIVSDNFERVWGSSRTCLNDGLTGFTSTIFPEDCGHVLSHFHLNLGAHAGHKLDIEFRVIDTVGELRWIWLRSFASTSSAQFGQTLDGNLPPNRLILIAEDVTEKKVQEESLRAKEVLLASQAKMVAVGELASGVAHEINNPLTVIVGRASELTRLAERDVLDKALVIEAADKIRTTSLRISKIILSLKSLARRDRGTGLQHVPIGKIFSELSDLCTEKFKVANVDLAIATFAKTLTVEVDPTLVSQMILNLMTNALDAVEREKIKWVKVDYTEDDSSLFIYVTDSGPGIPIKHRSRIFDPFFTTKDPGKGTGLGLSLSANIAAHHHGSLSYDHLHAHTRFVIQLPKQQPRQTVNRLKPGAKKS